MVLSMDLGCFGVVFAALSIAALIVAVKASNRAGALAEQVNSLQRQLEWLRKRDAPVPDKEMEARVSSPAPAPPVVEPVVAPPPALQLPPDPHPLLPLLHPRLAHPCPRRPPPPRGARSTGRAWSA